MKIPSNLQLTSRASLHLDFMRSLAALMVMLSHVRGLFFVDYALVEHPNKINQLLYFLTSLGHQSVIIFFVLSGFFISSSVFRMQATNRWSWSEYSIQRLARLWVVLVPALLLTWVWDSIGIFYFGPRSIYAGLPSDNFILGFSTLERLNLFAFIGNLCFLQGITFPTFGANSQGLFVPTFGSNGPLWSLSYEFWYYMAFPCVLLAASASNLKTRGFYIGLVILIGLLVGKAITLSFAIWMLGVVVIFAPHLWDMHRPLKVPALILGLAPFALSLVLSVANKERDISAFIAIAFTLLLYLTLRLPDHATSTNLPTSDADKGKSTTRRFENLPKTFAAFSYSLYLLHLPPLVFLHACLYARQTAKWQPTPLHWLLAGLLAIGITGYAWLISLVTEAKTPLLRALMRRIWQSVAQRLQPTRAS